MSVLITGAVVGFLLRRFIYGIIPGVAIAAVSFGVMALLCRAGGRWLPSLKRRELAVLLVGAHLLAAGVALLLLRPPSAERIIRQYVTDAPLQVSDARSFCVWARDPVYCVRLRTDDAGFRAILAAINGNQDPPPLPAEAGRGPYYRGPLAPPTNNVPEWWTPEQISDASTWRGKSPNRQPVRVKYDPATGVLYVQVLFL
ncbi:MAG: hypothetical protein PVJ57_01080 [Phycisphaerae bacterium]